MDETTIYDEIGVPRVINASGTKTRVGGTLIREEAVEAMERASRAFVRISDLEAKASELIADVTGAEAGYVTSGASAALTLAAAACIAGDDIDIMNRLPDTEGVPDQIVMPLAHRNGYDHALRTAGAEIINVGTTDYNHGCGSSNVEAWEIDDAIDEQTVAVAYLAKTHNELSLSRAVDVAHDNDVPVIVDAAPELPPRSNLTRFIDDGADLVAFSGGKAIRGPQSSGFLAGRADLIRSAALQHLDMHIEDEVWISPDRLFERDTLDGVPRQGIGRSMKVGKEEIVGLIVALECFADEDHDAQQNHWTDVTEHIAERLSESGRFETTLARTGKNQFVPEVIVRMADGTETTVVDVVEAIRSEQPRIYVNGDGLHEGRFAVNPMNLTDDEVEYVTERLIEGAVACDGVNSVQP